MSKLQALLASTRHQAGLSQLELALRLGYSARHISFVETGRAMPGRDLVINWLAETGASHLRTAALSLAGFTADAKVPRPDERFWSGDAPSRSTLQRILVAHEPYPAFVLDCDWRIIAANESFSRILAKACPDAPSAPGLDAVAFLSGECSPPEMFANADNLRRGLVARLRTERWWNDALDPALARLEHSIDGEASYRPSDEELIVLQFYGGPETFNRFHLVNASPGEITSSFCRVELWYPADAHTRRMMASA